MPEEFKLSSFENYRSVLKNYEKADPLYQAQAKVNVRYQKKLIELEDIVTVGKPNIEFLPRETALICYFDGHDL